MHRYYERVGPKRTAAVDPIAERVSYLLTMDMGKRSVYLAHYKTRTSAGDFADLIDALNAALTEPFDG